MDDISRSSLAEQWAQKLDEAIESMIMQRPELKCGPAVALDTSLLWYQSAIDVAPGASILMGASDEFWRAIGGAALKAAGLDDATPDDARGTAVEILAQACSSLARTLTSRLAREVNSQPPGLAGPDEIARSKAQGAFPVEVSLPGDASGTVFFLSNSLLDDGLAPSSAAAAPTVVAAEPLESPPPVVRSKTFDLLLEVELPVSVSFGRAQLPLRDVLKLSSGSIVELNRTITQPVEVIVNNCVIARGEVVVVEGNYGVRIQQVITREERLRTLN